MLDGMFAERQIAYVERDADYGCNIQFEGETR